MKREIKVLFFSTGNATRSRMAGAFLRRMTDERLDTVSTAVRSVEVNPLAMEVMSEVGIDMSEQQAEPLTQSLKEHFSVVVTLSDDLKERSPVWPFTRNLVHWNLPDPTASDGPLEQQREIFRRVRDEIAQRVREFTNRVVPELQALAG